MAPPDQGETEHEAFWRGAFGDQYTERNADERLVRANLALFARVLSRAPSVDSIVELGCNRGANLKALNALDPTFKLSAYEINATAAKIAGDLGIADVQCASILELDPASLKPSDLAFTKGVLIHIGPEDLARAYAALHGLARRYVMVCEYYNPTPMMVPYRGASERLYKRDFAGDLMERFDLTLVDYGFVYHRDSHFPQDDLTWFLLEKR
jgi:pseudaminic acid biosynthesis-associated methylase